MSTSVAAGVDARWWRSAEAMARAQYGPAWQWLTALAHDTAAPPADRSLALSARASLLRQVGAPDRAGVDDGEAWSLSAQATGIRSTVARADAALGLAADAVAAGEPRGAVAVLLGTASDLAADAGGWRVSTRLEWVRAEAALLCGDDALVPAEAAARICRGRSVRHAVKSRLIRAVALLAAGDQARADQDLRAVAVSPYASLHWVVAVLLVGGGRHRPWERAAWCAGLRSAAGISRQLPPDLRERFVAQPALERLRAGHLAAHR